ncbi:hypothetical protein Chro_5296 [Chroococcidiopsis thermalis PCC 7203]|jgi:hypothetical protein|uniref:Uncharacterized protein n=1 Tax=Chroococcidiopsis thermalis (strain PCC 7203) TaxID=251229 RepID=K9U7S4_CHRTP|nr:hypothetical protein Chro_5296 [Chroococcidiopsis thermalis PCC 7203]
MNWDKNPVAPKVWLITGHTPTKAQDFSQERGK